MMRSQSLIIELLPAALIALLFVPGLHTEPGPAAERLVRQDPQPPGGGMPDLVGGLRATPGCLGVETGMMASGKQSIFAWFENKQAVKRWYYSDAHEQSMKMLAPDFDEREPLSHIEDDSGPILVIATLTPSEQQRFEAINLPISQISIELFKPLPGGAFLGGRLSPDSFKVPHMQDYTPPAEGE